MKKLRFAVIGTGFWARYQIPAWLETEGAELVALYNRTLSKAEALAEQYNIPGVYDDIDALLAQEELDFVDIITDVDTHAYFTQKAAAKGIAVICQKPMAPSFNEAKAMLEFCQNHQSPLFIHENFRWQAPIRQLKQALDSGRIGTVFKAKVSFCSAFPVFDNQPFLAELEHFILTDIGSHVLDICRFLFGDARSLYALTQRVNPRIKGEDVAHVLMEMENGVHCFAEMSYASLLEKEAFPQTLVLVEGTQGSAHLTNDFVLKITTREGTFSEKIDPVMYPWLDPEYAVVHSSIVDCNKDILRGLQGGPCETTGADNLKTVALVWGAYASAKTGQVIHL
ncbi:MAG: gfo/Idh/MocA family oxidoreductase [Bacteroidetes bacterium]|nr:MAG: gfo/Idh/MocA family oxidoreductase [Bacteroidota bacterium]